MNKRHSTLCFLASGLAIAGLAFCATQVSKLAAGAQAAGSAPGQRQSVFPLVGTPSCSARACHGGAEPALSDAINRDEYTSWLRHDRHADAFWVLFDDRAKNIAKNLRLEKPAHDDVRCLACHTNPLAVGNNAEDILRQMPQSPQAFSIREERAFGVGCESCHGPAARWLDSHTVHGWVRQFDTNPQEDVGFRPMRNLESRAKACVGCHVGAPADSARGLPLRDVNHDLIAAGHPRMDFELSSFLANLPPHWNQKLWVTRRTPNADLREWLIGQVCSAQASLELLAERADPARNLPWPEFAEYDCFACHHGLQEENWRRQRDYSKQKPGSLHWGDWYYSLPQALARQPPMANSKIEGLLIKLAQSMSAPIPNRDQVQKEARTTASVLRTWAKMPQLDTYDPRALKLVLVGLTEPRGDFVLSPQSAEQLYQAAITLSRALGDQEFVSRNMVLTEMRRNADGFDSPIGFTPKAFREVLAQSLKRLNP